MNGYGSVHKITDPGGSISYLYYSSGKVKEIISPDGTTYFEYDLQGNKTKTSSINGGLSEATYNSLGQQVTTTNAKMQNTNYYYDSFGRLDYFTTVEGTTNYSYIASGNGLGQLKSISGPQGHTISYSYDSTEDLPDIRKISSG
jgi:YD repeat-containing protein